MIINIILLLYHIIYIFFILSKDTSGHIINKSTDKTNNINDIDNNIVIDIVDMIIDMNSYDINNIIVML